MKAKILELSYEISIFDDECAECPAQYAKADESPEGYWSKCRTKLKDIDTSRLHYVRIPENHIVIDFDLKDETKITKIKFGSKWPST